MKSVQSLMAIIMLCGTLITNCYANGQYELKAEELATWLKGYEEAWETRDPQKAATLFTEDASYQVDPFSDPHVGRLSIYDYWASVTSDQKDVEFTSEVLALNENMGMAHWHAEFTLMSNGVTINLDGIFVLEFAPGGKCQSLKEWWALKQ